MDFVLSKLLWIVVAPSNLVAWVLVVGVCLQGFGGPYWQRLGWGLTLFSASILFGFLWFPVDNWVEKSLEQRFPIPSLPAHVDGVIVLGGMVDPSVIKVWGQPKLNGQADRLTEFVHLARLYPEAKLIFSGGSGSIRSTDLTEAAVAQEILSRIGLPPERVHFEGRSRNTYENVQFSYAIAQPKPGETWVVVTSALHMPRAVGIFRQIGWPVLPYPVAFISAPTSLLDPPMDLADTLFRLDGAVHEWIGLIAYHLMGRTSDWVPKP